jgi:uncharacterized BrkB/YihY/UPF0761 family membrane protein
VVEGREENEEQTFAAPMIGMLCGSLVIVAVIAVLDSHIGRDFEDDIDAPARALVAVPVLAAASVVFLASMAALLPDYRRPALRVAAVAGWLIAAWLVMSAMVLGAIDYALDHVS